MIKSGKLFLILLPIGLLFSCKQSGKPDGPVKGEQAVLASQKPSSQDLESYETAYFASGCFWCVEAIFESVRGVQEVISGYAGGKEEDPTYEEVSYGRTTHAEAVEVYYDPELITYFELVQVFFGSHDPTTLNQQGPDRGPQYRSIAFYKDEKEKKILQSYLTALKDKEVYDRPIVTELTPFTKFYEAEDYHQDYERNNPNNSYIKNVSLPRLKRFKQNFPQYLKEGH